MRMWRAALLAALGFLVGVWSAPEVRAHGGQFIPPPTHPGNTTPRDNPRGNTPTHVDPGIGGGPTVTPGGGGWMKPGPVGRRKPQAITPTYETSWHPWWRMRERPWVPARRTALMAVVTPSEATEVEGRTWVAKRDALVRERVLSFLRQVIDPAAKRRPDVVASALIALGKLATGASAIPVLMDRLMDPAAPDIVRESAALGLGLLRRTEAKRRLLASDLDPVRGRLLQVLDGRIGQDRIDVPARTRQFAALSIGLLGDQPFSQDPRSKDGRLMSQLLWQRLTVVPHKRRDLPIALLSALGLQPPEGVPTGIRDELRALVLGKKLRGQRFDPRVRAHALTALVRLGDSTERALLGRLLRDGKTPVEVRIAAIVALAHEAERMASVERLAAARVLERALAEKEQELLVAGLLNLALGEVLGADLAEGSTRVLRSTKTEDLLEARARTMPWYLQGFAALGLGAAIRRVRDGDCGEEAQHFRNRAVVALRQILRDSSKEEDVRAAAGIALGLGKDLQSVDVLTRVLKSRERNADFRGYAALGLALLGRRDGAAIEAMQDVATTAGPELLRARAALALSVMGDGETATPLMQDLEEGGSTHHLAGVTMALGRLGELSAADALIRTASDPVRSELVQAMAIVALGILADPERTPSVLRYADGAPYTFRTPVLEELFTIL